MPVAILRPVSQGTYNQTTLVGAATKWQAVDPGDPVVHTDTSKISWLPGSAGFKDSFNLSNLPDHTGAVNSVTGNARLLNQEAGSHTWNIFMRTTTDGTAQSQTVGGFSGSTYAFSAMARPGGGAWSVDDINGAEVGISLSTSVSSSSADCSSLWVTVDYQMAWGGLMALIMCALPGVLGVAVPFSAMRAIAREVFRRSGVLITPNEYGAAWRQLRECRSF